MTHFAFPAVLCLGLLATAACMTTPDARFYTLNAGETTALGRPSALVLALGPIDLPEYLDRPQIVSRSGGNLLRVDEFNRWGGSLEEEVSRVLARHLGRRLATQRVYRYPSRIATDSDYRIALDIRRFDGDLAGRVHLDLAWSVIADRSGEVVRTGQASYQGAAAGPGYESYAAALSDTLHQFGDDLAVVLDGLAPPRPRR